MKRIYLYLTWVVFMLFAGLTVTGCGSNDSEGDYETLSVKQFFPVKVIEGQEVQITGTGLNEVTTVIFPGNISVTSFNKTGSGLLNVITPAGVSNGVLSVQAGNNTASAPAQLIVGNPRINAVMPNDEAGIGRELTISGVDMEFYVKVIFPGVNGDIVVEPIHFVRRSTLFIYVNVPPGIADGPARIRLVTLSGKEDLLPEIKLIGDTAAD